MARRSRRARSPPRPRRRAGPGPARRRDRLGDAEPLERTGQRGLAHLGRAAAAEHVPAGHGLSGEVRRDGPSRSSTWKRRTKRRSIQSFSANTARPFDRDAPLRADRAAVAQVQQREEVALRAVRAEPLAADARDQVVREHRALADRVHAGLGQTGARGPRRAVATAKTSSCPTHWSVGRDRGRSRPRRSRGPEPSKSGSAAAPATQTTASAGSRSPPPGAPRRPRRASRACRCGSRCRAPRPRPGPGRRARRVARQARAGPTRAGAPRAPRRAPARAAPRARRPPRRRPRPRRPRRCARRRARARAASTSSTRRDELADGARGDRVLADAGQPEPGHRGAHVEGRRCRRRSAAGRPGRGAARWRRAPWPGRRCSARPRAAPAADVDLEGSPRVLAGHEARHHAGVDRDRAGPRPRRGAHRNGASPALEDLDVGVPAAHQDEVVPDIRGARPAHARPSVNGYARSTQTVLTSV